MADEDEGSSSSETQKPIFTSFDHTKLQFQENPMYIGLHSQVYKGTYDSLPVAVQIIPSNERNTFLREVRNLCRLEHENIVKLIGITMHTNENRIITEFLQGGTLKDFLERRRSESDPLTLREAIGLALDIARAMDYVHKKNIIHRDLKPQNILLTENQDRAVLIDFGFSREEDVTGMTIGVGTSKWMAPEVIRDQYGNWERELPYDHKADVYSFSVVLWQLITKRIPYQELEMDLMDILEGVRTNSIRPSMEGIKIPEELATLIKSCWAANPADRPEFSEIITRLEALLRLPDVDRWTTVAEDQPRDGQQGRGDASGTQEKKAKKKGLGSKFFKSCFCPAAQSE